jgi:hypothetical protein
MCGGAEVWRCGRLDLWRCGIVKVLSCVVVNVWRCGGVDFMKRLIKHELAESCEHGHEWPGSYETKGSPNPQKIKYKNFF